MSAFQPFTIQHGSKHRQAVRIEKYSQAVQVVFQHGIHGFFSNLVFLSKQCGLDESSTPLTRLQIRHTHGP